MEAEQETHRQLQALLLLPAGGQTQTRDPGVKKNIYIFNSTNKRKSSVKGG